MRGMQGRTVLHRRALGYWWVALAQIICAAGQAPATSPFSVETTDAVEIFRDAAEAIERHAFQAVTIPEVTERALRELLYQEGGDVSQADGIAGLPPEAAMERFGTVVASLAGTSRTKRSPASLAEQAIALYCRSADSYSEYVDSATYSLYAQQTRGENVGVGISLLARDGKFYCSPLPGSPAERAGVRNGDELLSVAGRDVRRSTLLEIGALVRGEPGTAVELGLKRTFGRADSVNVVRERQPPRAVIVESQFGETKVHLRQISPESTGELRRALSDVAGSGQRTLVLDLRGSPGGNFDAICAAADLFLPAGAPIGTLVERSGTTIFRTQDAESFTLEKLTILQDKGTASAAELLICCLMENLGPDRVATHGETTFGKAAVITRAPPLRGGGQLMITSGVLHAPSGRTWEGTGLLPSLENEGNIFPPGTAAQVAPVGFLSASTPAATPQASPTPSQDSSGENADDRIEMVPVGKGSGRF